MELIKKDIHMNQIKGRASTQITLDDDFIVPDTMDDIAQVLLHTGDVLIEAVRPMDERVQVKGKMDFQVLYQKEEGGLQALAGSIPFDEIINVPGLGEKDEIDVKWNLEDLNADMIHSRKLGTRAIVGFLVQAESLAMESAAIDVDRKDGEEIQIKTKEMEIASIAVHKKDTYRIQEEISLPTNKPNIDRILWKEISLRGTNLRAVDQRVMLEGELMLFLLYQGEEGSAPVQWVEETIAFSGDIPMEEVREEMVPMINLRIAHKELEAKPDYDGEMREFALDVVLELDIKMYQEEQSKYLDDIYSTRENLLPVRKETAFQKILSKNVCKCKIGEKMNVQEAGQILQICRSDGIVKLDEVRPDGDGLLLEGVLDVSLLYLTGNDAAPIKSQIITVPFQCKAYVAGLSMNSVYQVFPRLEHLSAVMMGGNTVEIKAMVNMEVLVLEPVEKQIIVGCEQSPLDMEELQRLPGIVGYIVQKDDDLWSVAKNFHTTMDSVLRNNELTDENLTPGQKLILVKELS